MLYQFAVAITIDGRENTTGYSLNFVEATHKANSLLLSNSRHLKSYRVEVVELFGDKTRYAIHDKSWYETPTTSEGHPT